MGLNRAWSVLEIKSSDDDQRVIEGIASTPRTDRMGDIVEPAGAQFKLPIPLLWQHRSDSPIGHVIAAKVTDEGIEIRARIERDDEPGPLQELLDKAWRSIKKGLVRGLSIGFNPLEWSDIKGSFGLRFTAWEWLELSTVTIPANADATIETVKSIDADLLAALGRTERPASSRTPPGASGFTKGTPRGGKMTIAERIAAFEAKRAAHVARMQAITDKNIADGTTKDAAEKEEFDTLDAEIKAIEEELVDLRKMEKLAASTAKPVDTTSTTKAGGDSRDTRVQVHAPEKLEKGIEFARFAMCLAASRGNVPQALALAQLHYPQQERAINVLKSAQRFGMSVRRFSEELLTKANVVGGTTTDDTWAEPLVAFNVFSGDFIEFLRAQTILGQFGSNGIPSLRNIPFNVHIKGQTSGGTGYWVGEGKPKPVTKFDFNDTYHGWAKVAAIAVLTEELIRFSNPSAERLVRDALAGCLIEKLDNDFVDPTVAAVAGVSPASITNGLTAITSSGDTADSVRSDLQALWADAIAANLPMTSAVYITTPSIALALSLMTNALGQPEFPSMTMTGGRLLGVPVIVSNYVPAGTFILAFASEIYLSDDGAVTIDASSEASIQMLDNPTNDSVTPTPTTMVSMYQTDSIALRAHRFINWSKRRSTAVAYLTAVSWGGALES